MNPILTIIMILATLIAYGDDFDPRMIYDKLDAERLYRRMDMAPDLQFRANAPTLIFATNTNILPNRSEWNWTNSVGYRDDLVLIDHKDFTLTELVEVYHDLGGTNAFSEVDTNQITPLSLRLSPIPTPVAIEILDRIISDTYEKNEEPEQEAGVVREPRNGSRAPQP
jgi:hypothetical protein